MKKRKIAAFITVFVLVALAVVVVNSQKKQKLPEIKTVKVMKGDIKTLLSTNALVQSKKSKNYMGSAQYTVEQINVEVGQKVKNGDILLTYDLSDLETSVRQAEIQLDNAILNKEELLNQKDQIEKEIIDLDEQIYALDGSSNPQDIVNIQTLIQKRKSLQTISKEKIQLMDNSIAMAELSLKSARERLNKVKDGLKAEFDGTVTAVNAIEGSPLSMSQPAFVVQQLDNLKGIIHLGKFDAAKIRVGQKVFLKNSNNSYTGKVAFIEPAASKEMGMASDATLRAEIDIENPDGYLKIDFDINADILIGEAKQVLTLPIECLQYDRDDNVSVFAVKNGKAALTKVKIGLQSDTQAEIIEGLFEGDTVISNPSIEIRDGTVVLAEGGKQ